MLLLPKQRCMDDFDMIGSRFDQILVLCVHLFFMHFIELFQCRRSRTAVIGNHVLKMRSGYPVIRLLWPSKIMVPRHIGNLYNYGGTNSTPFGTRNQIRHNHLYVANCTCTLRVRCGKLVS